MTTDFKRDRLYSAEDQTYPSEFTDGSISRPAHLIKHHCSAMIHVITISMAGYNFGYYLTIFNSIDILYLNKHYYGQLVGNEILLGLVHSLFFLGLCIGA
jgi:hypothetical protein